MSHYEDPQNIINDLKAKVQRLEWDGGSIAMDKFCGEIDTLMYLLRQLIIAPRKTDWLEELEKEILNEIPKD